nr:hypothetical protein [uncultured Flavobacterium sp.]
MTTTDYQQQAIDFAAKHGVTMTVKYIDYAPHFADDKKSRHRFSVTLKRHGKRMTIKFGQSIAVGAQEPSLYDVLSCVQKHEVGTFENFCGDFGYDTDSRTAHRTYLAVQREFNKVNRLFSDCIEELQEIN